jgi:AraC-like DNA-binding protein
VGIVVDTNAVPPSERFSLWAEASQKVFEPLVVTRDVERPFTGCVWRYPLGPLTLYRVSADASAVRRTPATIGDSDPEWIQIALAVSGRCVVTQADRASLLTKGAFAAWASSRPYVVDARTPFELLVTYCPVALLGPQAERIRGRTAIALRSDDGVPRLLRQFVVDVADGLAAGSLSGAETEIADSLLSLFCGLYGAPTLAEDPPRYAPDLLSARIGRFIETNLEDRDLSPDMVARRHFISRSYLDKLFENHEGGVASHIRKQRLERCRQQLEDPRADGQSIFDIASRWGFVSPAHFSRVFRAAYGMSPREARRAAQSTAGAVRSDEVPG